MLSVYSFLIDLESFFSESGDFQDQGTSKLKSFFFGFAFWGPTKNPSEWVFPVTFNQESEEENTRRRKWKKNQLCIILVDFFSKCMDLSLAFLKHLIWWEKTLPFLATTELFKLAGKRGLYEKITAIPKNLAHQNLFSCIMNWNMEWKYPTIHSKR